MRRSVALVGACAVAIVALVAGRHEAIGAPRVGGPRPMVSVIDAWDRPLVVPASGTKPVLLVYEDKDSANENVALKDELSRFAKGDAYKNKVLLLAVADVSGYDFFPAKGFAKSAIRTQSSQLGTPIYCDWNGGLRTTLGLDAKRSNIVLYGRDGRVLLSHAGTMPEKMRKELVTTLKALVEGTQAPIAKAP